MDQTSLIKRVVCLFFSALKCVPCSALSQVLQSFFISHSIVRFVTHSSYHPRIESEAVSHRSRALPSFISHSQHLLKLSKLRLSLSTSAVSVCLKLSQASSQARKLKPSLRLTLSMAKDVYGTCVYEFINGTCCMCFALDLDT
ncbi:hypothetical protein F2Q69_00003200 [Brassica cretica]|uniref:Secreted protein n=1 Tax=Brassica cretica TaxID=69181 RepID=A0A8S9P2H2_BRACR|nr:hypothetical protein F2Q69_00003200 [Brassica cretica]